LIVEGRVRLARGAGVSPAIAFFDEERGRDARATRKASFPRATRDDQCTQAIQKARFVLFVSSWFKSLR
jgi:hypothetical protein